MDIEFIFEFLLKIILGATFLFLFPASIYLLPLVLFNTGMFLLRPYRNRVSTWIMIQLSPSYRKAKTLYEEILIAKEKFDKSEQGDEKLFEYIRNSGKFEQRSEHTSELWGNPLSFDALVSTGEISTNEAFEIFLAFFGREPMFHKVSIRFSYEEEFYLEKVMLCYDEEREEGFFKVIAKRKYLPPPEAMKGRYKVELPPVVPDLVTV